MYSPELLRHFESSQFVGEVVNADARVRRENPVCGDILELTAKTADGAVSEIRFRAKGCVPSIACAAALCSLVHNKPFLEARSISPDDLIHEVAGIPPASMHAVHLVLEALHELLRNTA